MSQKPPRLRAGTLVSKDDLADLARQAVEQDGRPRDEIAALLGQKPSAVSRATNQPNASATALRCDLVAELTGYEIEGPLYRVVKK